MVCTDAAARGIDIPNVTHVVQSSFAASAIDFLHRVRSPYHGHHHCRIIYPEHFIFTPFYLGSGT